MDAMQLLADQLEKLDTRPLATDVDLDVIGPYRGYRQLLLRWQSLAQSGGLRVRHLGATSAGAPLFALAIGPEMAPTTSVLLAGIHPIEWIGVESAMALVERLASAPPTDRVILVVPVINVDGYRQVEDDLRAGRRRWRRTNLRGVDLNRNWPTHFKRRSGRLARLLAGYNYGGPHPRSEPEIAAVLDALDHADGHSRIDVAVTMHSVGRMLLVPYGGIWRAPRDRARLLRAARAVQRRLSHKYRIRQSARWVPGAFAHGMELDHLHARYGATALLVECSAGGLSWRDRSSWSHPFRWFNPPDPQVQAADIASALEPLLRGRD